MSIMNTALMFYVCLTFGSSVLARDNIALRKQVYKSSVVSASYSTKPGNAVDGRRSSNMYYGSCTGTSYGDLHPWWMVDLGKAFKIHNIKIYIRTDTFKKNFHDFYIEMFLVNPLTWNFITPQQCLFYNGTFPYVDTLTCDGPVTGRYVRIRKIPRPGKVPMFLCEVEIRGSEITEKECKPHILTIYGGKVLQASSKDVVASSSFLGCFKRCFFSVDCKGINYNSVTQSCEMILTRSDTDTLLDDQEWRFVSLP